MKKAVSLFTVLAMLFAMASIGSPVQAAEETKTVSFCCLICSNDTFFGAQFDGMQAAAEEAGNIDLQMVGPAQLDVEKWIDATNAAISANNNGLLVPGVADPIIDSINAAVEKGIPVVTTGSDLPASQRNAFVGSDDSTVGIELADFVAEQTDSTAKILFLTMDTSSDTVNKRIDGFTKQLEEYPEMEIVTHEISNSMDTAQDVVGQALLAYPEIDCIVSPDSTNPLGAAQVIEEKELAGKVRVIGMSDDQQSVDAIRKGTLTASIYVDGYEIGYQGMQKLIAIMNGETVEEITVTELKPITSENVEEFAASRGFN